MTTTDEIPPFPEPVFLRCTVEVNGLNFMAQQPVSPALWQIAQDDPAVRQGITAALHQRLGAAIVRELDPPVTVLMPSEEQQR